MTPIRWSPEMIRSYDYLAASWCTILSCFSKPLLDSCIRCHREWKKKHNKWVNKYSLPHTCHPVTRPKWKPQRKGFHWAVRPDWSLLGQRCCAFIYLREPVLVKYLCHKLPWKKSLHYSWLKLSCFKMVICVMYCCITNSIILLSCQLPELWQGVGWAPCSLLAVRLCRAAFFRRKRREEFMT